MIVFRAPYLYNSMTCIQGYMIISIRLAKNCGWVDSEFERWAFETLGM